MTRPQGFDVRVAPEVVRVVGDLALRSGKSTDDARWISAAQDQLARSGTRAQGAKKLRALDLWEIRAGRNRLFFCLVPRTNLIALGAVLAKSSRRIRMAQLKRVERNVHSWRDRLEQGR